MTLAETIAQLVKVQEAIKQAKYQARSLDAEADNITKRFRKAAGGAAELKKLFQKMGLPEGLSKAIDSIAGFGNKSARLGSKLRADNVALVRSLESELPIRQKMQQVQDRLARSGMAANSGTQKWLEKQQGLLTESRKKQGALTAAITEGSNATKTLAFGSSRALAALTGGAVRVKAAFDSLDGLEIGAGLLVVGLVKSFQQFNAELVKASSELALHNRMYQDGLAVRIATGATADQAAKAQAALAAASLQFSKNNQENLRFVVLLESSLGIAAGEAAELVRQSESLGASVGAVGDAMAWVANKTDLAGNKTAKVAIEMANVVRNLGLAGSALPALTAAVGAMEGQFTRLGGSDGGVVKLIQHFSSLKGIGDAVMFGGSRGILDPSAFEDVDKIAGMIKNTGQQLKRMTGGDPLRLAAMEPMLQKMGMTLGEARALMKMTGDQGEFDKFIANAKESKKLQEETGALEARYSEQLASSGKLFSNLWQRVRALTMTALLPLLKVVNWLMEVAIQATKWLTEATLYVQKSGDTAADGLRNVADALGLVASVIVGGTLIKALREVFTAVKTAGSASALLGAAPGSVTSAVVAAQARRSAASGVASGVASVATAVVPAAQPVGLMAKFSAGLKAAPNYLKVFGTGLWSATKLAARMVPVWGWAITAIAAGAMLVKKKIDGYNETIAQEEARSKAIDKQLIDIAQVQLERRSFTGDLPAVASKFESALSLLSRDGGLTPEKYDDALAMQDAVTKGMARRVEVQRDYVREHPEDIQASDRFNSEQRQIVALGDIFSEKIGELRAAAIAGTANQINTVKREGGLNRSQEDVQESYRRASQPSGKTY